MNNEIKKLQPVPVLYGPVVAPLGEPAVLAHRTREGLIKALRERQGRGEITDPANFRFEDGVFLIDVRLTPLSLSEIQPRPRWVKPAKVAAGIVVALGVPFALGLWLASSLGAVPLGLLLLFALVALVALIGAARRSGERSGIIIQQNVNIHR